MSSRAIESVVSLLTSAASAPSPPSLCTGIMSPIYDVRKEAFRANDMTALRTSHLGNHLASPSSFATTSVPTRNLKIGDPNFYGVAIPLRPGIEIEDMRDALLILTDITKLEALPENKRGRDLDKEKAKIERRKKLMAERRTPQKGLAGGIFMDEDVFRDSQI